MSDQQLDNLCVNTLRILSAEMVEKAKSGHPGLPLGASPMAYVLWTKFLRHNPGNPKWQNRDRFILSAGHGSALLYSLLHLTGYNLPLEELKNFRQWESKCPGHPEYGLTPGVETTTGPLGQGFANGIGMALGQSILAARYNKEGYKLFDYTIYGLVSDGDLMEGISSEAASFAGSTFLGKLIYFYDSNKISIEGSTDLSFKENVSERFKAYNWQVLEVADGNNLAEIAKAVNEAKTDVRPTLINVKTHIGFGSPKQDSAEAHGEPLGSEALKQTKINLNWPLEQEFYLPQEAVDYFRQAITEGEKQENSWQELFKNYQNAFPDLAKELTNENLPVGWDADLPVFDPAKDASMATRAASGKALNALAKKLPLLLGGSADLAPSNKTYLTGFADFTDQKATTEARNIHFGVREHAMGAILNGLALTSPIIPYGGTFFIFTDYFKPAIRLAALMNLRVIYVLTHDSIGVGEDGPTHQPIEHLMALRAVPNLLVIRPADANETAIAWQTAINNTTGPTALVLTRQNLATIDRTKFASAQNLTKGAYVLNPQVANPDLIIIATGSEVELALASAVVLQEKNIQTRVVSMPSWRLFEAQSAEYKEQVLPANITARLSIEAGSTQGWQKYIGLNGMAIGLDRFGASAPAKVNFEKFGFTVENVVARALKLLNK
ncbi:MAG: transketolase [Patescibacteria group bacterium]|jgi:transketolase